MMLINIYTNLIINQCIRAASIAAQENYDGLRCETTEELARLVLDFGLAAVRAEAEAKGVRYATYQLDSFWYPKRNAAPGSAPR